MKYYRLQIKTGSKEVFQQITDVLAISPLIPVSDSRINYGDWIYEVEDNATGPYYDFIDRFISILEPNFSLLAKIGIATEDITFWCLYAYDQQCNLEFHPKELKRLGDFGISLCISCWEK
ncbi:hypothetical protein HRH25_04665 [Flavisolibacter sp. BT320]|nr:hypothetical protein [Flavisolibacter longurius]